MRLPPRRPVAARGSSVLRPSAAGRRRRSPRASPAAAPLPGASAHTSQQKSYTVSQDVSNLAAGTSYTFSGWVNIPATTDELTFQLEVEWRDAKNKTLGTSPLRSFSSGTDGWTEARASLVAPAETTNAQVRMVVKSPKETINIYTDDFAFWP